MRLAPALPWTTDVERGTIQLKDAITIQDIANNKVAFIIESPDGEFVTPAYIEDVRDSNFYVSDIENEDRLYEGLLTSNGKQIVLTRVQDGSEYTVTDVVIIPDNEGITIPALPLDWKTTGYMLTCPKLSLQSIVEGRLNLQISDGTTPAFAFASGSESEVEVSLGGDVMWGISHSYNALYISDGMPSLTSGPSIVGISVNENS